MDIKHNMDPTTASFTGKEGFNFTENAGIMPSTTDKTPAGEREVNRTVAEKTGGSTPKATGSGY